MMYNSKGLALAFLFFNIIFTIQVNGQLPGFLPPIPNLVPPLPFLVPPVFPGQQSPPAAEICPKNTVKIKIACADVLGVSVLPVGAALNPLRTPCCKLVEGLLDIEVAACFCRALTLDAFIPGPGIPMQFVKLFNYCQKEAPPGYVCESS
ncbi:hypothetical protein POM88_019862 [Heracleum sosnowskyi]|uniref:Hydrophobic seed protein domain-containing protein n=1 Tax=Heracleum sosnowskyi TaxID=360622 RepID=A0AAD8MR98_9APIA|nr:hypothetical protein POM88_019862 [Heracleum sosnowskyi]